MTKVITPIITIIIAIIIIFAIGKNLILKAVIEGGVKQATGLHLTMDSLNLSFTKASIEVKNMKLYNPSGFSDKIMCEIPEMYLDIKLGEIFKGKIHVGKATLNLSELTVEKNEKGETNVDKLKPVKEAKKEKAETGKVEQKKSKPYGLQIDELNLKVGKVVYKDFTATPPPSVKEYNVDLDETYRNITDLKELVNLILVKALMKTSISRLANLNVSDLQSSLTNVSGESFKTKAETTAVQAAEKIKSLF